MATIETGDELSIRVLPTGRVKTEWRKAKYASPSGLVLFAANEANSARFARLDASKPRSRPSSMERALTRFRLRAKNNGPREAFLASDTQDKSVVTAKPGRSRWGFFFGLSRHSASSGGAEGQRSHLTVGRRKATGRISLAVRRELLVPQAGTQMVVRVPRIPSEPFDFQFLRRLTGAPSCRSRRTG